MSRHSILVINPNSNQSVTDNLAASLGGVSERRDVDIECQTLPDGPFGIESNADIAAVVPLLRSKIAASPDYDAFVIACYSDPGLAKCRALTDRPVYGIHECALMEATSGGRQFGVLALSEESIRRHLAYIGRLGFAGQLAAELPLDVSVDQAANDASTPRKIIETGRRLVDEFGAEVLILGCAGMAVHRQMAESSLGVPVIDPTIAAVSMAAGAGRRAGVPAASQ